MEIGSMDSTFGMMGMQGMQGMQQGNQPPPPPEGDASEMSSSFMDAMDSDGDSLLSQTEFASSSSSDSSEVFDALDTNEDGFVSQDELEADMQSKMDSMKSKMQSMGAFGGLQQNGDMDQFQQLMDMAGGGPENQAAGAERYGRMQEGNMGSYAQQALTSGLSITA